ncbi:cell envelope biogenesis protein OmpA [Candidatus Magnetomorum sp. HK-1]|nr:cell envelope biogenesis protein OmpA [Candidatus Magnetomorum sp. HK-1]
MNKRIFALFAILITCAVCFSCQAKKSGSMLKKSHQMIENALSIFEHPINTYDPTAVSPVTEPGKPLVTDHLVVIFDQSISMQEPYVGLAKSKHAQKILMGLNNSLPEAPISTMFKTFTDCPCPTQKITQIVSPLAVHNRQKISETIASDAFCPAKSPLAIALETCKNELSSVKGKIAVVIITDGNTYDQSPVLAAESLYNELGPRLGIYPILVGNSPYGKRLLNEIAERSVWGFVERSDCLIKNKCMRYFIQKIFYTPPKIRKNDRDKDGIYDHLDDCPTTPEGSFVNDRGCSADSDGDGISDDRDQCPGTPQGLPVESNGCPPKDLDKDGVLDIMDKCPETPVGATVNADGCSNPDQDQDGVLDSNDDCLNTPLGASVNTRGCWVISDIRFSPGKWDLTYEHKESLQEVIDIMRQNIDLRIEIQGHTDNTGSEALNKKLSSYRAMSVMKYLLKNNIKSSRLTFMGYGSEKPVVSNDTLLNRSMNRRVEFSPKQ